jgi:hypothetical protein
VLDLVEVDVAGNVLSTNLAEEPVSGQTIVLTIDARMSRCNVSGYGYTCPLIWVIVGVLGLLWMLIQWGCSNNGPAFQNTIVILLSKATDKQTCHYLLILVTRGQFS